MQQLRDSILDKINIIATNNFVLGINNNINLLLEIIDSLEILSNHQEDDLLRQDAILNINDDNDYRDGIILFWRRILSIANSIGDDNYVEALSSANSASNLLHRLDNYLHNTNNMHGGNKQEILDNINRTLDHYKKTQLIIDLINEIQINDKVLLTRLFRLITNCSINDFVGNDLDTIKEIYRKYVYSRIKPVKRRYVEDDDVYSRIKVAKRHDEDDEEDMKGGNKDEFINEASEDFPSKEFMIELLHRQERDPYNPCIGVLNEVLRLLLDKYDDKYVQGKINQYKRERPMLMRQHATRVCTGCGMDESECTCN